MYKKDISIINKMLSRLSLLFFLLFLNLYFIGQGDLKNKSIVNEEQEVELDTLWNRSRELSYDLELYHQNTSLLLSKAKKANSCKYIRKALLGELYYFLIKKEYSSFEKYYEEATLCLRDCYDVKSDIIIKDYNATKLIDEGKYRESLEEASQGLILSQKHNDTLRSLMFLSIQGRIFQHINVLKAIEINKKYLALARIYSKQTDLYVPLLNLGTQLMHAGQLDSAMNNFTEALTICKSKNYNRGPIYNNIGSLFSSRGDLDSSILYFELAVKHSLHSDPNRYMYYLNLAESKLANKELDQCKQFIDTAEAIVPFDRIDLRSKIEKIKAQYYFKKAEFKQSANSFEKHVRYRDSLFSEAKEKEFLTIQAKYEKLEKELEISNLKNQNLQKQIQLRNDKSKITLLLFSSVSLVLFLVLLYLLYHQKNKKNQQLSLKNEKILVQKEKAEIKALLAQMNPHFISNFLSTLNSTISNDKIKDKETLNNYIDDFGKLSRMILEHSSEEIISLNEELNALQLYLNLETIRTNNKFTFFIDLDRQMDIEETLMPPFILQPFVENAIWHGVYPLKNQGKVEVLITRSKQAICFKIKDNGVGYKKGFNKVKTNKDRKSFAIEITRKRIELICEKHEVKSDFKIRDLSEYSNENGTLVEFNLPIMY